MPVTVSSTLPEDWITVDMVNRYTFCPRLFHLMYVQGRWEENEHTEEGKDVHRRVDRLDHILPEARVGSGEEDGAEGGTASDELDGDPPPEIARSVSLGSDELGLLGKLDLVSADPEGGEAIPVETKKSRVPNTPERSYPTERVQLMAQGLLLRAHGYRSNHGYLYFAGSRQRVRVDFTPELEAETRAILAAAREARASTRMPPPLDDSPKCWGCSLCGICLPDETNALRGDSQGLEGHAPACPPTTQDAHSDERTGGSLSLQRPNLVPPPSQGLEGHAPACPPTTPDAHPDERTDHEPSTKNQAQATEVVGPDVRRLFPARDRAMPFYVQEQGAKVGKSGERLAVSGRGRPSAGPVSWKSASSF